jgi:uncharacterized protein YndB with AHSA1/START domain
MAPIEFRIPTRWLVEGSVEEVYDLISMPQDFVRWWSDVYLRVEEETDPGDENGVGKAHRLHTRGRLPFTLDWQSRITEAQRPVHIVLEARGDLEGRGEWRLRQDGGMVHVDFDWTVVGNKPFDQIPGPGAQATIRGKSSLGNEERVGGTGTRAEAEPMQGL